jgi:hypothetical protein
VELEKAVAETGKTPLQVLLDTMRHYLEVGDRDKAAISSSPAGLPLFSTKRPVNR